jgi:outer membrane protein assembly factor BamB
MSGMYDRPGTLAPHSGRVGLPPRSGRFFAVALGAWVAVVRGADPGSVGADAGAGLRNWGQWRGPLANGVAPRADPPREWSETRNVRWKAPLPGNGHASPIVWGDRVFVLAAVPVGAPQKPVYDRAPGTHDNLPVTHRHAFVALAFDRARGTVAWQQTLREEFPHEGGHQTGSLASNSPTTDGESVYAFFGSRGLYCLGLDGRVKWEKDFGRMQTLHAHGEGSSPVLSGDTLIVCWDHEAGSFLYALDKHTGALRWKVDRDESTAWATPIVVEHEGRLQVVTSATKRVRGYALADGALLWECGGLTDNVVASPVFGQGLVVAGNSYYRQAMFAVRLAGARGDVTSTDRVVWRLNRLTPYVSSPLWYDDTLYFLRHNQNVLSRLDPLTGRPRGEPLRLEAIRDFLFASPVGAAGRIYVTGRDGTTVVLRHDRENGVLAVNTLDDTFSASPALVDREFFLRGERSLYCLAETPAQPAEPAASAPPAAAAAPPGGIADPVPSL